MPVPVAGMNPESLAIWAQAIAAGTGWVDAVWARQPPGRSAREVNAGLSAEERFRAFEARASRGAQDLARILAGASVLSWPLISVLQARLLSGTGVSELTEVLVGGLLERIPAEDEMRLFRFRPAVADLLRRGTTAAQEWDTFEAISDYLERYAGTGNDIRALLADPSGLASVHADLEPFALLGRSMAARLGLQSASDDAAGAAATGPAAAGSGLEVQRLTIRDRVSAALDQALTSLSATEELTGKNELEQCRDRFLARTRVALTGQAGSGKSVLANALVGADVEGLLDVVNCLRYSPDPQLTFHYADGRAERADPGLLGSPDRRFAIAALADRMPSGPIAYLETGYPSPLLTRFELIEIPAAIQGPPGQEQIALADILVRTFSVGALATGGQLQSLQPPLPERLDSATIIGVLTKIEQFWSPGQDDVMVEGTRRASRLKQTNPMIYDVYPLACRVAAAAATFTDKDFAALAVLAAGEPKRLARAVRTSSSFATSTDLPIPREDRTILLQRFTAYGIVLACDLIRNGADDHTLRTELDKRSGMSAFRQLLISLCGQRTDRVKAQYLHRQLSALSLDPASGKAVLQATRIVRNAVEVALEETRGSSGTAGTVETDFPVLAIDFGASVTRAALVQDGEIHLVTEPSSVSEAWPSAVYVDGDTLLVGTAAERHKRRHPGNYLAGFKHELGRAVPFRLGGKNFMPVDLVTATFGALRTEAERMSGGPVTRALLTIPSSYSEHDPRRELMIDAAGQADFVSIETLPEALAAASAPLQGAPFAPDDLILVYDFGGSTFDATLIKITDRGHEPTILAYSGLADGGQAIDAAISSYITDQRILELPETFSASSGDASLPALSARMDLQNLSMRLKHQLSDSASAEEIFGGTTEVRLDRATLDELMRPLVEETVRCCQHLLDQATVTPESLAAILVVGGSSRMPIVTATIAREFGRPIRHTEVPEWAIVLGAARWHSTHTPRGFLALPG